MVTTQFEYWLVRSQQVMISQNVEAQVQQGSMLRPNRSRSFMENAFARALKTAVKNSTVALILLFGLRQGN